MRHWLCIGYHVLLKRVGIFTKQKGRALHVKQNWKGPRASLRGNMALHSCI